MSTTPAAPTLDAPALELHELIQLRNDAALREGGWFRDVEQVCNELIRLRSPPSAEALESLKPHSKWLHLVAERLHKQQRDYSIANTCEEAADAIDSALSAIAPSPSVVAQQVSKEPTC